MEYEAVIGLEIHAELKTRTKMFCDSLNDPDEKHPNINICPVCMGHPGTLPVANREAIEKVIQVGLAVHGSIPQFSQFDRKNYFYPDLPKGYQISQYEHPLVKGGWLEVIKKDGGLKKIRITRVHLEEDTGRLIHDAKKDVTLVDFNRAGVPLMELVTEPDLRDGEEARLFAEELRAVLRFLEASEADMEKGEMRIEANISLRPAGYEGFGTKVEVKNINSFRFVEDAIAYEIKRQSDVLAGGGKVVQETRGWDEKKGVSVSQRIKEEAHDYRYFPEPDLPPLTITQELVDSLAAKLPELPQKKQERFQKEFWLERDAARFLAYDKQIAAFFEGAASEISEWCQSSVDAKMCKPADLYRVLANFIATNLQGMLAGVGASVNETLITAENLAELVIYVVLGKLSQPAAKEVLKTMFETGADPSVIADEKGLWQVSDTEELEKIVSKVIDANEKTVAEIKAGKTQALQFLVGQVMKESKGKANPGVVQELVKKRLGI
ncbi:MAG: Asp-tRNA(Asn)/Glu-tRNA(Gln) amidotransferase subunit GatB [Candidatus Sungbacteria bacterium]|nr:Asp-tRNA(Asn)/Glu-tRNA(Gln) amidotransferase subunit GatB [Candidatus Sungbacteria bacterium]